MTSRKLLNLLLAALVCASLAGCSKPFSDPHIRGGETPTSASFKGLVDYLDKSEPLRVLWVHGMCDHDIRWVRNRSNIIKAALQTAAPEGDPPKREIEGIDIYEQEIEVPGSAGLIADFLVWTPLTKKHKSSLEFDSPDGGFPHTRAKLNNQLKVTLMNDCFADAVIYAGTGGKAIKMAMQAAVCTALGGEGQPNNGSNDEGRRCKFPPDHKPPRLALVAESLGSKFLIDAIKALWTTNKTTLAQALAETRTVFLLSNQLPLLDLADLPASGQKRALGPEGRSLDTLIDILQRSRGLNPKEKVAGLPALEVVEFTDPNDLLSYRLPPAALQIEGAKLVNVAVSNDWTYVGLLENPYKAHCGYGDNGKALGLVVRGHTPGDPIEAVPLAETGSCD